MVAMGVDESSRTTHDCISSHGDFLFDVNLLKSSRQSDWNGILHGLGGILCLRGGLSGFVSASTLALIGVECFLRLAALWIFTVLYCQDTWTDQMYIDHGVILTLHYLCMLVCVVSKLTVETHELSFEHKIDPKTHECHMSL